MEPTTVRPRRFDQAQEVADRFKEGNPVIMNLEGADREVARRLIDFASGLCYGLDGSMEKVANGVYLLKPVATRSSAPRRLRRLRAAMDLTPSQVAVGLVPHRSQGVRPRRGGAFLAAGREGARGVATAGDGDGGAGPCRGRRGCRRSTAAAETGRRSARRSTMRGAPDSADVVHVSVDEAETISRTLVLAQRTADATIADATAEAERLLNEAARRVRGDARLDPRDVGQAARGGPGRGPQGLRGGARRGRERGAVARRPSRVPRRRCRPARAVPDRAARAAAHRGAPARGDVRARARRSRPRAAARAVGVRRPARRRHRRALPAAEAPTRSASTTTTTARRRRRADDEHRRADDDGTTASTYPRPPPDARRRSSTLATG